MKHVILCCAALVVLSGCGDRLSGLFARGDDPATGVVNEVPSIDANGQGQLRPQARPGDAMPTTQTPKSAGAGGVLGKTIASLGSPAQPGLWLKTPLVSDQQAGKVSYKGKTIDVTLIPIEGPVTAGSRMSLQAFQALGAPLTDLPEVSVSL